MSALAFELKDLRVAARDGTELVSQVNLEVGPGDLLGLVGETGAGKTLTVRAMLGLLPTGLRASGRARLRAQQWLRLDRPDKLAAHLGRETALMLQNPMSAFDPMVRLGPQLAEAVVRNGVMSRPGALERAAGLCEELGLGEATRVLSLYPHQLSGGMIQRAALALALMPSPQLLVADEPTSALDANLRSDAMRLLKSVAQERRTAVVIVSHDLGLVSHFCQSIAVLYAGHLVEAGPAGAVLNAPSHPYTRTLIACSLRLDGPRRAALPTIGGEPPVPGRLPTGCYFHPRCPDAQDVCVTERPHLARHGRRLVACHLAGQTRRR